jgi:hypothetical protein
MNFWEKGKRASACLGETKNAYKIFVNLKGRDIFDDLGVDEGIILKLILGWGGWDWIYFCS